jgi:hypothetical protein
MTTLFFFMIYLEMIKSGSLFAIRCIFKSYSTILSSAEYFKMFLDGILKPTYKIKATYISYVGFCILFY